MVIPQMLNRWFRAAQIPFSSRMNRVVLIEGLKQVEAFPKIIVAYDNSLDRDMTVEAFVAEQVMRLPAETTKKIPNPANGFAFWLSTQDLKQSFLTLEESVLSDLKRMMGAAPDLEIDAFVEHCRDKMGQLKTQLELLSESE